MNHSQIEKELIESTDRHKWGYPTRLSILYWMDWFACQHIEFSSKEEYLERIKSLERKAKEIFWEEMENKQ